jgi:pyruvate dehydrogenase E1 component alpha subunit
VGHSRIDAGRYRPAGELDRWRTRDPLSLTRIRLSEEYGVGASRLDEIDQSVDRELAAAEQAGLAAPFPVPGGAVTEYKA